MIFLHKIYNNIDKKNKKSFYQIKIFNDFIFFCSIIKEYIKFYNLYNIDNLKTSIYLLVLIAIKYVLFIANFNTFFIKNSQEYKIYTLELFTWNYISIGKILNNIEQKILLIKKISRTREKGRIRRYKVVVLIGNKSGWFGIGHSKDYHLQQAIIKARLHAYKNIYHIPLFYSKLLNNNLYIHKNSKKLYLFSSKYKIHFSKHYFIRILFDFIGITNISSKIIRINNIYKILSLILNI